MPEVPSQICADVLANESGAARRKDEIHEMPEVWKTKLAEESINGGRLNSHLCHSIKIALSISIEDKAIFLTH